MISIDNCQSMSTESEYRLTYCTLMITFNLENFDPISVSISGQNSQLTSLFSYHDCKLQYSTVCLSTSSRKRDTTVNDLSIEVARDFDDFDYR